MRVQDVMTKTVATIPQTESADTAFETMLSRRIRHLVATDGTKVAGILSAGDLGSTPEARRGHTVAELMTRHAVEATPEMPLPRAANLMRGRTIGCLPVMAEGKLVGIVTVSDLLRLLGRGSSGPGGNRQRRVLKARAPRVNPPSARSRA